MGYWLPFEDREPVNARLVGVPLQVLAYHTAVLREAAVDQPRNLAKSVMVA